MRTRRDSQSTGRPSVCVCGITLASNMTLPCAASPDLPAQIATATAPARQCSPFPPLAGERGWGAKGAGPSRTPARAPREGCEREAARPAAVCGARLRCRRSFRLLRSRSPTPARAGARPNPPSGAVAPGSRHLAGFCRDPYAHLRRTRPTAPPRRTTNPRRPLAPPTAGLLPSHPPGKEASRDQTRTQPPAVRAIRKGRAALRRRHHRRRHLRRLHGVAAQAGRPHAEGGALRVRRPHRRAAVQLPHAGHAAHQGRAGRHALAEVARDRGGADRPSEPGHARVPHGRRTGAPTT